MMRSLFSGISGLKSLQSNMDVIGNNVSNVNTTGYKSGRITFQDALSQTMTGATAPGGLGAGAGGTNPVQMGLGVGIAGVDTQFSQGNLQKTGQTTDMAIQGSAFFVVANDSEKLYTRDGAFTLDANGHLVMPGNGLVLQGFNADEDGKIASTAVQGAISIPYNTQAPAKPTTEIDFARNLNADSNALGTITYSNRFLGATDGTTRLSSLCNNKGQNLQIHDADTLTLSASNPSSGATVTTTVPVGSTTTLNDLATSLQSFLNGPAGGSGTSVSVDPTTGELKISAGSTISQLQVSTTRPTSDSLVANAFFFPTTIASGDTSSTASLLRPATATDKLSDVFDSNGVPVGIDPVTGKTVGLEDGDTIDFSGSVGGNVAAKSSIVYKAGSTTMQDVLDAIQNQLHLPQTDGTMRSEPTVSLNAGGADNNVPEGVIVLRGLPGSSFSLADISVHANDGNNKSPSPNYFNTNLGFHEFQAARDAGSVNTSITAYDEKGFSHTVSVLFTKSQVDNEWYWQAAVAGSEKVTSGGKGKLTFGTDGTVSNFSYDDSNAKLVIDPQNGSNLMEINLNPGGPGKFAGLTQFKAANTAAATSQDGHTMGSLQSIAIGTDGIITGQFSNGVTRSLAQVEVADFTNPQGLSHQSDSVYAQSANSGDPVYGKPGSQSTSTIQSGTLEMSNVDLAGQFTDMITTQRGYQANARVITTSDSLLQELVGLVR
jgi:flagellar hook protein FlgE